jgi:hypothetical protein
MVIARLCKRCAAWSETTHRSSEINERGASKSDSQTEQQQRVALLRRPIAMVVAISKSLSAQNPIWPGLGLGRPALPRIMISKKPAKTAANGSINIQNSVVR